MTKPESNLKVTPIGTRSLAWPALLWAVWVVFPSLVVAPASERSNALAQIIAGQVGSSAVPYLQAAPRPLLIYLLSSYLLALPTVLLLGRRFRMRLVRIATRAQLVAVLVRCLAEWLALYFAGVVVVVVVMLLRGADTVLVLSWGVRLACYGAVATLPQVGWVVSLALIFRRTWLWVAVAISGALVMAILSSTALTQQVLFPTPLWLREQLLSGHAEASFSSVVGLATWGILLASLGVAIRRLSRARETTLFAGELDA